MGSYPPTNFFVTFRFLVVKIALQFTLHRLDCFCFWPVTSASYMYVYFCILLRCKSFMNLLRQDVWESLWCSCFSLSIVVLCKTKHSHTGIVFGKFIMYMYFYIYMYTLSLFFQFEESCRIHSATRSIFSFHIRFLELLIVKTSASTNQILIHLAVWRRSREITYTLEVVFHLILAPNGL